MTGVQTCALPISAITRSEMRRYMRDQVGMDLDEDQEQPLQPPAMQPNVAPPLPPGMPIQDAPPVAPQSQVPPEMMAALGGVV